MPSLPIEAGSAAGSDAARSKIDSQPGFLELKEKSSLDEFW